jgi:hypothetical protein
VAGGTLGVGAPPAVNHAPPPPLVRPVSHSVCVRRWRGSLWQMGA